VAGSRAAKLERDRNELIDELKKQRQEDDAATKIPNLRQIDARFRKEMLETGDDQLYGLKTREEFEAYQERKKTRRDIDEFEKSAEEDMRSRAKKKKKEEKKKKKKKKDQQQTKRLLSFGDDEVEDQVSDAQAVVKKNPHVDTAFLPDREREESAQKKAQEEKKEWLLEQARIKQEDVEIVFSFWDGMGTRRSLSMKKGDRIGDFLDKARLLLAKDFPNLKGASVDSLMYIKEDLIIPHYVTFYDLIISKARGKTGPLFNFSVQDDIRLVNDIRVQTDHSHAGKVCERVWYEQNKHIYPASRWEAYDPTVATKPTKPTT